MYRTNIHIVENVWKILLRKHIYSYIFYMHTTYSQRAMTSQCLTGIVGMRNCTWWQLRMQSQQITQQHVYGHASSLVPLIPDFSESAPMCA